MKKKKILSIKISNWNSFKKLANFLVLWHFRGQSDASWDLSSSMERYAKMYNSPNSLEMIEKGFIYQFQRRAHHYISHLPKETALLEWLAMLQHFGCPTRLLDFTHSFYVATFFAVETAVCDSAIWAIDHESIQNALNSKFKDFLKKGISLNDENRRNIKLIESYIGCAKRDDNFIIDVEPEFMSERLSIQQGLFLFPLNMASTFLDNLLSTFSLTNEQYQESLNNPIISDEVTFDEIDSASVIKFIFPIKCHATAIHDLKNMNITAATLFPGLDGFARSLKYAYRRIIDEDWDNNLKEFILKSMNKT